MLPMFRILLAAASLAILALAAVAQGLVARPEAQTRIGEVPAISRSFIQQAMVPRLPIQAASDPAEERGAVPEVNGMAIVQLPLDMVDSGDGDQTIPLSARTADETESSDPLGDLIKATLAHSPEPQVIGIGEARPSQPPAAGLRRSVPAREATAAPPEPASEPSAAAADAAAPPSTTRSEDAAQADGKDAAPEQRKDAAARQRGDSPRLPSPGEPPALASTDGPADREKAKAGSRSKTLAAASAALKESDTQGIKSSTDAGMRRDGSARKAVAPRKHRTAVEPRTVRRKAVIKSRTASSWKSRKAAQRVKRHKSRVAAERTPRRGAVVVAPRRRTAVPTAPAVEHLSPVYPHQVVPGGYYLPPAGTTVVR